MVHGGQMMVSILQVNLCGWLVTFVVTYGTARAHGFFNEKLAYTWLCYVEVSRTSVSDIKSFLPTRCICDVCLQMVLHMSGSVDESDGSC
jgi:hypothetical protein